MTVRKKKREREGRKEGKKKGGREKEKRRRKKRKEKREILVRMWRYLIPCALLVGMQSNIAAGETVQQFVKELT